jgi:hypothetical protein
MLFKSLLARPVADVPEADLSIVQADGSQSLIDFGNAVDNS